MVTTLKTITIVSETCCNCGVVFGLTQEYKEILLNNGENFYCPNGHSQYYTKKKNIEKKLEIANKTIENLKCRVELCREESVSLFCSWRFQSVLFKSGVETIGDALKMGENKLRKIYGVGDVCINEIKSALAEYDVNLKS